MRVFFCRLLVCADWCGEKCAATVMRSVSGVCVSVGVDRCVLLVSVC